MSHSSRVLARFVLGLSALGVSGLGVAQKPVVQKPVVRTTIGIEGRFLLRHQHRDLRARPLAAKMPVLLRIADIEKAGGAFLYDLRFIGEVAGTYDLRRFLQRLDGQPLRGVEAILVEVSSLLPAVHSGELNRLAPPAEPSVGGYRMTLWLFGIVWTLPVLWLIGRRLMRRGPPTSEATTFRLTLADQLRPLFESARRGDLEVRDRGRLELLLLGFWRHRLGLADLDAGAALARMRDHGDAGRLLRALEDWLHRRPGTVVVGVDELLEPYTDIAALDLPDLPASLGRPIERPADDCLAAERSV